MLRKVVRIYLIPYGIGALILLFLINYVSNKNIEPKMGKCIFCDISAGKMPDTKLEVETDEYVIFKDIKPASTYHYLAVPKKHYESLKVLNASHETLVQRMEEGLKQFLTSKGINATEALFGFHLPPFITVPHLHMHAIAPKSSISFYYRIIFKPGTAWFKTTEEAREYLKKKNEL